jgi:hypothetical protein
MSYENPSELEHIPENGNGYNGTIVDNFMKSDEPPALVDVRNVTDTESCNENQNDHDHDLDRSREVSNDARSCRSKLTETDLEQLNLNTTSLDTNVKVTDALNASQQSALNIENLDKYSIAESPRDDHENGPRQ